MKFMRILIISIIFLLVFLIYLTNLDTKVYYLSLGNNGNNYSDEIKDYLINKNILEVYVGGFINNEYRVIDIINDIDDNKNIIINEKKQSIKNALIKADLVTIYLDNTVLKTKIELNNQNSIYEYINDYLKDYDTLFKLLREYSKEDIIFINEINISNKYSDYYINEMKQICERYDIIYIDTTDINNIFDKINDVIEIHLLGD